MKNAVIYPQVLPACIPQLCQAFAANDTETLFTLSRQVDEMQLALFRSAGKRQENAAV